MTTPDKTATSLMSHPKIAARVNENIATSLRYETLSLDEWGRFVDQHPESTPLHHPRWLELITRQYGLQYVIPAVLDGDEIVTAVPLIATRSLSGKRRFSSLPYSDYVPPLVRPGQALRAAEVFSVLRDALCDDAQFRCEAIVIRGEVPLEDAPRVSHWLRHVLDIDRPFAEVKARFHKSIVRDVRAAAGRNLSFDCRTDREAVEIFYRLHLLTRKKLGVPVQPKGFFIKLHEMLLQSGLGFISVVSREATPLAAAIFLTYNRTVVYKFSASHPVALNLRPNPLLMHNTIERAVAEGYRQFDFGVSAHTSEGLRQFKQRFGPVETDAVHTYLAGLPRAALETSSAMRLMSAVIRRSPPSVCRLLGELLYKYSQ